MAGEPLKKLHYRTAYAIYNHGSLTKNVSAVFLTFAKSLRLNSARSVVKEWLSEVTSILRDFPIKPSSTMMFRNNLQKRLKNPIKS
jgi:hypothetical protein